jgi:hypothetical protein
MSFPGLHDGHCSPSQRRVGPASYGSTSIGVMRGRIQPSSSGVQGTLVGRPLSLFPGRALAGHARRIPCHAKRPFAGQCDAALFPGRAVALHRVARVPCHLYTPRLAISRFFVTSRWRCRSRSGSSWGVAATDSAGVISRSRSRSRCCSSVWRQTASRCSVTSRSRCRIRRWHPRSLVLSSRAAAGESACYFQVALSKTVISIASQVIVVLPCRALPRPLRAVTSRSRYRKRWCRWRPTSWRCSSPQSSRWVSLATSRLRCRRRWCRSRPRSSRSSLRAHVQDSRVQAALIGLTAMVFLTFPAIMQIVRQSEQITAPNTVEHSFLVSAAILPRCLPYSSGS